MRFHEVLQTTWAPNIHLLLAAFFPHAFTESMIKQAIFYNVMQEQEFLYGDDINPPFFQRKHTFFIFQNAINTVSFFAITNISNFLL